MRWGLVVAFLVAVLMGLAVAAYGEPAATWALFRGVFIAALGEGR